MIALWILGILLILIYLALGNDMAKYVIDDIDTDNVWYWVLRGLFSLFWLPITVMALIIHGVEGER